MEIMDLGSWLTQSSLSIYMVMIMYYMARKIARALQWKIHC
jgi:hypothetical protein